MIIKYILYISDTGGRCLGEHNWLIVSNYTERGNSKPTLTINELRS